MPKIWSKDNVKCFANIFGGSIVAMNSGYENVTINDSNNELVDIYKTFKIKTSTEIYNYIYKTIIEAKLKKVLKNLNNKYKKSNRNSIDVFLFEKFGRYSAFYLDKNGNCNGLFGNGCALANKASILVYFLKLQNFFENYYSK